ncbi:DNA-binding transcriptional LysR family regulator [Bradyrhizobium japonicum]|nr:DNA-binding transcriptional LysR family regulator [Bradyrhizobium japonicum]MCP1860866.1 DNA-binding transcriptional LysR family regulator [Bradyrhizobium japonicum]MCP1891630.1 DNA-binding transcriptional LysR family regulator [Bradyrhizobium japonicum]MCW2324666.1 DNA-binding transcriptional LysR family regulator [Bradyrhizobium japonicum]
MFDLNQLRCFVTVAEELHFGRAAARLNMTQPPLSRQIQVLEHIIDAPLLERTSRSVRLTPAGRSFLPEARRILKLAESASQVARRIALGKTGSVKIGFTAAAAYGFLPELVAACRAKLPEVDFSLKEMVSGDQFEALTSGQIDAGLLRPPIARPELTSRRVVAEPLLAAIPKKHPLANAESITIKDFDDQPFVMYSPYESRYFHDLLVALHPRRRAAALRPASEPDPFDTRHGPRWPRPCHRAGCGRQPEDLRRAAAATEAAHARSGRAVHGLAPRRRESAALRAGQNRRRIVLGGGGGRLMLNPHRSI